MIAKGYLVERERDARITRAIAELPINLNAIAAEVAQGFDLNEPVRLFKYYRDHAGIAMLDFSSYVMDTVFEFVLRHRNDDDPPHLQQLLKRLTDMSSYNRAAKTRQLTQLVARWASFEPTLKYDTFCAVGEHLVDADASLCVAHERMKFGPFVQRIRERNAVRAVAARILAATRFQRLRPGMADVMREIVKCMKLP